MKRPMGLLLGLAVLAPAPAFAAGLTPEEILAKVSQTYSGLTSFRLAERRGSHAPMSMQYTPPDLFGGRPARYETDLAASIPGKIRLVVKSREGEIWLVSDGRKTWEYIPNLNEYTETVAAPLLEELWTHPIYFISVDFAQYRSLAHEAGRAKLRGEKTLSLGGQEVRCYVVDLAISSVWRTLWIDEQRFLVLRDQLDSPAGGGPDVCGSHVLIGFDGWISQLTNADLGPISKDVFQLAVPSGARRVDSFSAPSEPAQAFGEVLACLLIGSTMESPVQGPEWIAHDWCNDTQWTQYVGLQGTRARDFTLGILSGENVRLEGLHGKIVVLSFWASWCKPCQEELAVIQKLHEQLAPKGVAFLGIDDESPETVEDFVKAHGYTFPMLLDRDDAVHGLYGVRFAPTTVVIDRKGKIAAHYVGAGGEAQLRQALKSAGLDTTKP